MAPEEKAKELYNMMDVIHYRRIKSKKESKGLPISMYSSQIKQCAINCVNDKISFIKELQISDLMKFDLVEEQVLIKEEILKLS